MLRDVDGALGSGLTLLCCAPTGIGKTVAALHPALCRAYSERRTVFFVTAKTSQQELALDTLRRMIEPGDPPAVQITAREKLCPLDGRRCSEQRCRYQERFAERLERSHLLDDLADGGVVDGATIQLRALERRLCPFEVSLSLAERAAVVVADLNYVFDPNVYLRRFFDRDYGDALLIVDEAHNLPDRAAEQHSAELDLDALEELAETCLSDPLDIAAAAGLLLAEICSACRDTERRLAEERDMPPWVEDPDRTLFERLAGPIGDALAAYTAFLAAGGKRPAPRLREHGRRVASDPLLAGLRAVRDFGRACAGDPELFAALWSPGRVRLRCLDAAAFLRQRTRGFHASVFMSATLSPLDFFRSRLGADGPRTVSLDLPCPFPRENRLIAAVDTVDTTYRNRSRDAGAIADIIGDVMALRKGNYLAFFSSYAYRDEVVSKLPRNRQRLLLQLPGMPAATTLGLLRNNPGETRLLCAVQGGVFSEGVDYPGDMAIGVFVVGPGLPGVDAERELVRSYYERCLGQGFEYGYVYPGLQRAVQSGGRALRTPEDRAFTLLLGRRFAEPLYRSRLPQYWQNELITTDDPVAHVRAFWERG
jgi:DNA excision repair protein ERCC-2